MTGKPARYALGDRKRELSGYTQHDAEMPPGRLCALGAGRRDKEIATKEEGRDWEYSCVMNRKRTSLKSLVLQ
jgi:hypothetical protein